MISRLRPALALLLLLAASPAAASGRIEGRVTTPGGAGIPAVAVTVAERQASTITDPNGSFGFDGLDAGTYRVEFSAPDQLEVREGVVVVDGRATRIDQVLDWELRYSETITVQGASRYRERLVEAPASVSVISTEQIESNAAQGQLPRLLQSAAGVELTQNGVYDFNLNVRGFNTVLNRRVLVLIDGRDPGGVLLGAQEWGAFGLIPDDIARIELVRGPVSALYGSNAYNGVVNFISKEPRFNQGGRMHATFGQRDSRSVNVTHSGGLSERAFYKVYAQYARTDDFYQSRRQSTEYPGLPLEVRDPLDRTYTASAGARLDRYFGGDRLIAVEANLSQISGNMFATPIGRSQNNRVRRPWTRASLTTSSWNVSGYYDGRIGGTFSLPSGMELFDTSAKVHVEALRRLPITPKATLLAGAAGTYTRVDSANPDGVQTLFRGIERGRAAGGFGQFSYEWTPRLTTVAALRVDGSTLHEPQWSPKASAVFAMTPQQTVRVSYGHAFQAASFVEYFTRVAAAPPVPLGLLEQALAPVLGGVPLGFASVPVLAVGNDALKVETIDSIEAGYSGVVGRRMVISADYYRSWLKDFISTLLPQVGTSLGRVNPVFGPYQPPAALNAVQRQIVMGALASVLPPGVLALLSNDLDGSPAVVAASFTNFGRVRTQGLDLGVQIFPRPEWTFDASYSRFQFDVTRDLPDDPVTANAPPHHLSAGAMFNRAPYGLSARYRWTDDFVWKSGVFRGPVASYSIVDMVGQRSLTPAVLLRIDVANLFDDRHYELFGGDLLRRRLIVDTVVSW